MRRRRPHRTTTTWRVGLAQYATQSSIGNGSQKSSLSTFTARVNCTRKEQRWPLGFTIVELLIVLAIVGILGAIVFTNIPRDHFAVRQAATGLARDVELARFQAISRNTYVIVEIDTDDNSYVVSERDSAAVIKRVNFDGHSRTPNVRVASVDVDANDIVFDPRGIGIGLGPQTIILESTISDFTRTVTISQPGKVDVQ